jgi:CO/xanthine dehydrogenase Mo-binding subunit
VYAPTQGISNCRIEMAHDLKMPLENVRVVCKYMGGGFGNKNQCHDFDLMAAMLAKKAGAPVKLEFTRKEDFRRGAWPLADQAILQGGREARRHADRHPIPRLQRHGAVSQEFGRYRRRRNVSVSRTSRKWSIRC